ncbi:hypothetical protein I5907_04105 [Panacibacter sp. DH6]|uniref:DNA-binding protein n=1 Tax=Panacibacter microcysteis TaxID=2793269 RepID=A0A931GVS5_9BACT|nr:hypothetical protein [Panacibacter microcysteis]MBG9375403.1 hypothetical protein [Panacibacter microcysteis]
MPKALFIICCLFLGAHTYAQQKIDITEISQHTGDSVTVCAKVFGGIFLSAAKNQPTFLNVGAAYPHQPLTVVIWNNTRKLFSYKPEEQFKGKTVCVTGKVELFNNKPQIVVQKPEQLEAQ